MSTSLMLFVVSTSLMLFVVASICLYTWLAIMWTPNEIWKLVWIIMVIWALIVVYQDHQNWRDNQIKIEAQKLVAASTNSFDKVDNL